MNPHRGTDLPTYLLLSEAAELSRLSVRTLRRAIAAGELVAFKPGGRVLIGRGDLVAWIEAGVLDGAASPTPIHLAHSPRRTGGQGGLAELDAALEAAEGAL